MHPSLTSIELMTGFYLNYNEELGELTKAFLLEERKNNTIKYLIILLEQDKSNLADEAIDVFCHALLVINHFDIDLARYSRKKMRINMQHTAQKRELEVNIHLG